MNPNSPKNITSPAVHAAAQPPRNPPRKPN